MESKSSRAANSSIFFVVEFASFAVAVVTVDVAVGAGAAKDAGNGDTGVCGLTSMRGLTSLGVAPGNPAI